MTSPGDKAPEQPEPNSENSKPYQLSARYTGEHADLLSRQAFRKLRKLVEPAREAISAYRLKLWSRLPQEKGHWFVTVIGEQPSKETEARLTRLLAKGERITLPEEIVWALNERRKQVERQMEAYERRRNFRNN